MMQLIKRLLEAKYLRLVAFGYSLFITIIMLLPVPTGPKINIPFIDKAIHAFVYIGFILIWFLYVKKHKKETKGLYLLVSLLLFIYGIVIEVLQGSFVATRTHDIWDIVANATGIVIGIVVFYKAKDTFLFKK